MYKLTKSGLKELGFQSRDVITLTRDLPNDPPKGSGSRKLAFIIDPNTKGRSNQMVQLTPAQFCVY